MGYNGTKGDRGAPGPRGIKGDPGDIMKSKEGKIDLCLFLCFFRRVYVCLFNCAALFRVRCSTCSVTFHCPSI
jgi:hypothetical protein